MPKKISDNTVTLFVNGRKYENWLDVSITCTLQSLARVFSVRSTRSKEDLTIGIQPQDEVKVFIGDDLVLTGYVTKREVSYSASGISITISGASKTVDLQDCCMPHGMANSYKNQTHEQNLKAVCAPFGIGVVDQVKSVDRRNLEFSPTETVGAAVTRYLQKNGILLTDDEAGNLGIAQAGSGGNAHDTLELGKNILEGKRTQDASKRFSDYVTLGQAANPTSELPVSANHLKATARDPEVRRARWFVKQEPGNASTEILQKKAEIIKDMNAGESDTLTYKVQGWRQNNGELWKVNTKVSIFDSLLEIKNIPLLISKIGYSLSSAGSTVELTCISPQAFRLLEEKDSKTIGETSNLSEIKIGSGKI